MAKSEGDEGPQENYEKFEDFVARREGEVRDFEEKIRRLGIQGAAEYIKDHLEKWREMELNFAVIGMSGSGKSSFINAVRRLHSSMAGAAPVGPVQTTRQIRKYEHPKNPKVQFWDLPGVGTPEFPRAKYIEIVKFEIYDVYIIMTSGRLLENDLWLANEARKRKKNFYFVRTKIDLDIAADRRDAPVTHSQVAVLERVRQECQAGMISAGFANQSVFLISSWQPEGFEFPALEAQIFKDLRDLKRAVAVHVIESSSEPIISAKAEQLRSRAWKVAVASALAELSPIPGTSICVDLAVAWSETLYYSEAFGLESLIKTAQALGIAGKAAFVGVRNIIINMAAKEMFGKMVADTVARLGRRYAFGKSVQAVLRAIPFYGALMNYPLTATMTYAYLSYTIDKMENAALAAIKELQTAISEGLEASE